MSGRRILIVGYYGKGNFGDDVLLSASYELLRQAMPDADISVLIDGSRGAYVQRLLKEATVLPFGRHGHFDLIVHGGGGVHFDFRQQRWADRFIECGMRCIGFPAVIRAEEWIRRITGLARTSATARIGIGIGVGTYAPGSPWMRAALPIIAEYDALWVRDSTSVANLERFRQVLTHDIILGSDLAFLTHYWLKPLAPRATTARPRLGIILRDWAEELGGLPEAALRDSIAALATEYDITGFIFNRHTDQQLQRILAPYATYIWQPESMRITDVMERLAQQDVLLTSRVHGAVCGACAGVASVIVGIEPKLAEIAAAMPNACELVNAQQPQQWAEALRRVRSITPEAIAKDVATNRAASAAALAALQRWLV